MKLSEILEANFNKWRCLHCNLEWWLAKEFTPAKCPFRGHNEFIIDAKAEISLSSLKAQNTFNKDIAPLIELLEKLTLEDYANIFKLGE